MNGELLISYKCPHTLYLIYTTSQDQFLQVRSFKISICVPSAGLQTRHLILKVARELYSLTHVPAHQGASSSGAGGV